MAVDAPVPGRCVNEYRSSFGIPKNMGYPNIAPDADMGRPVDKGEGLAYGMFHNLSEILNVLLICTKRTAWTGHKLLAGSGVLQALMSGLK